MKGHNHNHDVFDFTNLINKYNIYEVVTEDSRDEYDINMIYQDNQDNLIGRFVNQLADNYYNDEIYKKAVNYGLDVLLKNAQ